MSEKCLPPSAALLIPAGDAETLATVKKWNSSTPVWIQQEWQSGEFSQYIQKNGCGHCCVAMALRLCGIPTVTPYDEYLHCRTLWGAPNEERGECHFLSVRGVVKSLEGYGITAAAYGVTEAGRAAAVQHILCELWKGNLVLFSSLPLTTDNPFSPGAHYVLFVGITEDGRVAVANSSTRARTDTPGLQTVTAQMIEEALPLEVTDPNARALTWGVLDGYRKQVGYVVIECPQYTES